MPFQRVPIVHRFGIISHSQRIELQKRLLQQAFQQSTVSNKPQTQPFVLEVTDEFVQQYNSVDSVHETKRFAEKADKLLERIKRKAGVKTDGVGDHVDLPMAWTDLIQLAQCNGPIQGKCLHVLLTSLERAPLAAEHIVTLFFLAETTLYWLRSGDGGWDGAQPAPGSGERLNIGRLVFMRLFHHHMTGQLDSKNEFKNRLFSYLDGFTEYIANYAMYPDVLFCLRYINDVGMMLLGDGGDTEPGEVQESDAVAKKAAEDAFQADTDLAGDRAAITTCVHDLCPTLWHSLDVWRCAQNFGGSGLQNALPALAQCAGHLASESWVDAVCAIHILGHASISSLPVLQALHDFACGLLPTPLRSAMAGTTSVSTDFDRDTVIPGASRLRDTSAEQDDATDVIKTDSTLPVGNGNQSPPTYGQLACTPIETFQVGVSCHVGSADTGRLAQRGTATTIREHEDDLILAAAFTNTPLEGIVGLHGWHWEVAMTYVHILTDVCLYGITSNIQKVALLGRHREATNVVNKADEAKSPMSSAGLLDLLSFHAINETSDGGANDWSWRVRYAAMSCIQRVCDVCSRDKSRLGIAHAAWRAMMQAKSLERDRRVLDAVRAAELITTDNVDAHDDILIAPPTIGGRLASSLVSLYLPTSREVCRSTSVKGMTTTAKPMPLVKLRKPKARQKPMRTSLREEIELANAFRVPPIDFKTRTDFDLRRVVEDQWRKQCHKWTNTTQCENEETSDENIPPA